MKRVILVCSFLATCTHASSLRMLTLPAVEQRVSALRRTSIKKNTAAATLIATAGAAVSIGLYLLVRGLGATNEHGAQEILVFSSDEKSDVGFFAAPLSGLWGFVKGFSRQAVQFMPQVLLSVLAKPATDYCVKNIFYSLDLKWALRKFLINYNRTHVAVTADGAKDIMQYSGEIKLYKHDILHPAYMLDPDDTVMFEEKNGIVVKEQAPADNLYLHTYVATMNELTDSLITVAALAKHKYKGSSAQESAQALIRDLYDRHAFYMNLISAYVLQGNNALRAGLLRTTVEYLNSIERVLLTLIQLEDAR